MCILQKQLSENVFIDERRPVLLCDGKLCLRALQDLFNLTIVEMMHGMRRLYAGCVIGPCLAQSESLALSDCFKNISCIVQINFFEPFQHFIYFYCASLDDTG